MFVSQLSKTLRKMIKSIFLLYRQNSTSSKWIPFQVQIKLDFVALIEILKYMYCQSPAFCWSYRKTSRVVAEVIVAFDVNGHFDNLSLFSIACQWENKVIGDQNGYRFVAHLLCDYHVWVEIFFPVLLHFGTLKFSPEKCDV